MWSHMQWLWQEKSLYQSLQTRKDKKKYTTREVSSVSDKETVQVSDITPAKQQK